MPHNGPGPMLVPEDLTSVKVSELKMQDRKTLRAKDTGGMQRQRFSKRCLVSRSDKPA